jgi:NADH-quinone oxidoreductase subunit M
MFPFHTWAPTGHVAAPTAASMLLAGVVMKLGAYGCLRVAMPLFPEGFVFWQPTIAWLAVIGIVYAGFVALVQEDFKFVIGYSSVSHMGFVLLGLAAGNTQAVSGAVLQMFSHGVIAGLLFAVVGRMVYDRLHTRRLSDLRGMPLHRHLPFAALAFVLAGLASMGMPGFSGFPAELTTLVGAWKASPVWAVFAAAGVLIAAAFTLRAIHVSFFGATDKTVAHDETAPHEPIEPITWPERAGALLLIGATVYIGLKPDALLHWITPALQSPLLQTALRGGVP